MATLTVGKGMQFATIEGAVAASHDGDVVLVSAGVYKNDFVTINDSITLESVGGAATIVATEPPPNLKGLILVGDGSHSPDVTINGFVLKGAAIPAKDGGNGAGIRYQSGNLTLSDDVSEHNQDGILATPIVSDTGTIIVNDSTFASDGSGAGYTHNLYIGHVAQFVFQDSVSTGAIVGHDIKSRAFDTEILNSTISDGPTGTASYEIEICNGGTALIQGNTIVQGPKSENPIIISYAQEGDTQPGSLVVTGNLIENQLTSHPPVGIFNASTIPAVVSNNEYSGLTAAELLIGPGTLINNISLTPAGVTSAASIAGNEGMTSTTSDSISATGTKPSDVSTNGVNQGLVFIGGSGTGASASSGAAATSLPSSSPFWVASGDLAGDFVASRNDSSAAALNLVPSNLGGAVFYSSVADGAASPYTAALLDQPRG
ncbi:MAG TPA: hypothetical protein VFA03_02540 [Acetobacteraceae bacterium]|nr:hypothetical protein [Acetobacteraceae bacterium]